MTENYLATAIGSVNCYNLKEDCVARRGMPQRVILDGTEVLLSTWDNDQRVAQGRHRCSNEPQTPVWMSLESLSIVGRDTSVHMARWQPAAATPPPACPPLPTRNSSKCDCCWRSELPADEYRSWAMCWSCRQAHDALGACSEEPHKINAGLLFLTLDPASQQPYLLLGKEKNGKGWCIQYGTADAVDADTRMVAIREGAEESCYAVGTPRELMNYFLRRRVRFLQDGVWLLHLDDMSHAQRQEVVERHGRRVAEDGWLEVLDRKPETCEQEHTELCWVDANTFLESVEAANSQQPIHMEGLDSALRGLPQNLWFQLFWLRLPQVLRPAISECTTS